MAQIDLFFTHLPPVTRLYLFSATALMLLCTLDILSPFSLYMNVHFTFHHWQLWRLVTCFLFFGSFSLPFFWNVYVLIFYCGTLEEHQRSAAFLWMLITTGALLLTAEKLQKVNSSFDSSTATESATRRSTCLDFPDLAAPILTNCNLFLLTTVFSSLFGVSSYFYSGSIINVMTYVWGRRNPHTRLSVFFVSVQAPYLPFVLLLVSLLVGWNLADHLIGIFVGHIYYFFEDIYPLLPTGKGRRFFRTPRFLLWLLNEPPE